MGSLENIKNNTRDSYARLPNNMKVVWDRAEMKALIKNFLYEGYVFPVTFSLCDKIAVPDRTYWQSGNGIQVINHVFFFENEMTERNAEYIAKRFHNDSAYYLALERKYVDKKPTSRPEYVWSKFSATELSAWMSLFWDPEAENIFVPKEPHDFVESLGKWENKL